MLCRFQRLEMTPALAWKTLKDYLAFDRNLLSHPYDEAAFEAAVRGRIGRVGFRIYTRERADQP